MNFKLYQRYKFIAFPTLPAHFKYNFDIVAIAIMPDHLHMIIKVDNINDYPKIIYSMKYYFSKYINVEKISLSESKIKNGEKSELNPKN